MNNSRYLPGYSYGMSGGPMSLSQKACQPNPANESKEGNYTFTLSKGKKVLDTVTFWAPSLRAAQEEAQKRADALAEWPTFAAQVSYEEAPKPQPKADLCHCDCGCGNYAHASWASFCLRCSDKDCDGVSDDYRY